MPARDKKNASLKLLIIEPKLLKFNIDSADPFKDATLKAAEAGEMEKLKDLITSNEELVKAVDNDGYTPLHRSCYGNHVEVVKV